MIQSPNMGFVYRNTINSILQYIKLYLNIVSFYNLRKLFSFSTFESACTIPKTMRKQNKHYTLLGPKCFSGFNGMHNIYKYKTE